MLNHLLKSLIQDKLKYLLELLNQLFILLNQKEKYFLVIVLTKIMVKSSIQSCR